MRFIGKIIDEPKIKVEKVFDFFKLGRGIIFQFIQSVKIFGKSLKKDMCEKTVFIFEMGI